MDDRIPQGYFSNLLRRRQLQLNVFRSGELGKSMEQELSEVYAVYETSPNFVGFSIHFYES